MVKLWNAALLALYSAEVTSAVPQPHIAVDVEVDVNISGGKIRPTSGNYTSNSTSAPYWLEEIRHQGFTPFTNGSYDVFRSVKDFGAIGDGIHDDTAAINKAMSYGGRCEPGVCLSSTKTPAIIYFPAGTYRISSSIIDYYYTQIIGNPNDMPVLKATSNFTGLGLIDGDLYGSAGIDWNPTNVFFRQVRNLIFDMTAIPANTSATGIHWPSAQATSLQNLVFQMSDAPGTQHEGVFLESGSGGFMTDLVINGGNSGVSFGNQQYTIRNITFNNVVTAIYQSWDWGFTYLGMEINNCSVGLNMSIGGAAAQGVVSVTLIDSTISNTNIGISTAYNGTSLPYADGSLILDNVVMENVPVAIQGPQGNVLGANATFLNSWGEGTAYVPNGHTRFEGPLTPFARSENLAPGGSFYSRSKPQYEDCSVSDFISVRTAGAVGDGVTDDTAALNRVFEVAAATGKVVYIDFGIYKVTSTVCIPPGSRIVGESYPIILGSGAFFSSMTLPMPVVQVGLPHEEGIVEWSDTVVSTQGPTSGAILIQWNLASPASTPSGLWDVHTRIGGFAGSDLQWAECPTTPNITTNVVNPNCTAAFMSVHISEHAEGIYFENNWFWVADHDMDHWDLYQINIFAGRGLYCESKVGNIWLVGTAVEHHSFYEYQFANTMNIFAGQIQTETAYWQPNPDATIPFPVLEQWNDPDFEVSCANVTGNATCAMGWGLRIIDSEEVHVYGGGLYSFFNNYSTNCSDQGNGEWCQARIVSLEGNNTNVGIYNLNTVGTRNMITINGVDTALFSDNLAGYVSHVALFSTESETLQTI